MRRLLILLAVLAAVGCVILLIGYEVIFVDFVSFMEDQPSVDYQDSPRILAPNGAVLVSRPTYLDDPANLANPVPPDGVSLQRGEILFDVHCSVCHGPKGRGDGSVVEYWREDARRPANLTDAHFSQYPDALLYGVVTQGVGGMPPLRENMTERQYWDVINFVRSLQP
jgi:mono/diheme cytochrome c family protein